MTAPWVGRLERRLGFLTLPNLAYFLAGMNALSAVLSFIKPEFPAQLMLDPSLILRGQVWRALTFIFVPPSLPPLWLLFWLMLYLSFLSALERDWGDFKFTLYALLGALSTTAASLATGLPLSSAAFVTSLFLAFARLNPELQILLFFVIPVKMKWIAAVTWAMTCWTLIFGGYYDRVALAAGLFNYALYFSGEHLAELKLLWRRHRYRS